MLEMKELNKASPALTVNDVAGFAQKEAEANVSTALHVKTLHDKLSPWIYLLPASSAETLTLGFTDVLKDKPKPTDEKKADEQKQNGKPLLTGETT